MTKQIKLAVHSHLKAINFIRTHKMKKYFILPGLLNIFALLFLIYFTKNMSVEIFEKAGDLVHLEKYKNILFSIIKFSVYLILFIVYYLIYKAIILILMAPFLAYISEKTEVYVRGKEFKFSLKENIDFVMRGIKISLKCFFKEFLLTFLALIMGFLPIIGVVSPLFILAVQSYYIGYSFMDYTLERHHFDYKSSLRFARENKAFLTVSGSLFTLMLIIPIIGIFIAPNISAVSATLGTLEMLELKN